MLNFRFAQPTMLVGLRRIDEAPGHRSHRRRTADRSDGHATCGVEEPSGREACPLVGDALIHVGHPQIRARGTVGGTVAHSDPAAELPAALLAAQGAATVRGPVGSRSIPADELFTSAYTTTLAPGEIITDVRFPAAPERSTAACVEISRRPGTSRSSAACQLASAEDDTISGARVVLFAVADVPLRAISVERALIGQPPTRHACSAAAALVADDLRGGHRTAISLATAGASPQRSSSEHLLRRRSDRERGTTTSCSSSTTSRTNPRAGSPLRSPTVLRDQLDLVGNACSLRARYRGDLHRPDRR